MEFTSLRARRICVTKAFELEHQNQGSEQLHHRISLPPRQRKKRFDDQTHPTAYRPSEHQRSSEIFLNHGDVSEMHAFPSSTINQPAMTRPVTVEALSAFATAMNPEERVRNWEDHESGADIISLTDLAAMPDAQHQHHYDIDAQSIVSGDPSVYSIANPRGKTVDSDGGLTYATRRIKDPLGKGSVTIVLENQMAGPSPLIALCNALAIAGELKIPTSLKNDNTVSGLTLISMLKSRLLVQGMSEHEANVHAMALCRMQARTWMDPMLKDPSMFSKDHQALVKVFQSFKVSVRHGCTLPANGDDIVDSLHEMTVNEIESLRQRTLFSLSKNPSEQKISRKERHALHLSGAEERVRKQATGGSVYLEKLAAGRGMTRAGMRAMARTLSRGAITLLVYDHDRMGTVIRHSDGEIYLLATHTDLVTWWRIQDPRDTWEPYSQSFAALYPETEEQAPSESTSLRKDSAIGQGSALSAGKKAKDSDITQDGSFFTRGSHNPHSSRGNESGFEHSCTCGSRTNASRSRLTTGQSTTRRSQLSRASLAHRHASFDRHSRPCHPRESESDRDSDMKRRKHRKQKQKKSSGFGSVMRGIFGCKTTS